LFLFILIGITIITYYSIPIMPSFSDNKDPLIRSLIYISCAGGIGGIVYCIRGFYQHLFEKDFDNNSTWWYIFRPFLSVVMGVFVYFLIVGGLLSIGQIATADYSKSIMFYCAISFLAGFSFTQVSNKLEELASTLFAKKEV